MEVLQHHYNKSGVKKRKAEAVARTMGKKKTKKVNISLENVDEWDKLALDGSRLSDEPKKETKGDKNSLKIR